MATSVYEDTYHRLLKQKAFDSGIELFGAIIEQIPQDAEGYIYRAQFYARKWKIEEALSDITKALEIMPDDGYAHYILGDIRRRMLDFKGAIGAYTKAISAGYTAAYNNRGVLLLRLKKYRAAYNDFTLALKYDPANVRAYHNRGVTRCHLKDFAGAIRDLTIATTKKPDYLRSYVILGCAYFALGKEEPARNALCHYARHSKTMDTQVRTILVHLGGCRDASAISVRDAKSAPSSETRDASQKQLIHLSETKPLPPYPEYLNNGYRPSENKSE